MKRKHDMPFGAETRDDGSVRFRLWAPRASSVALQLKIPDRTLPMSRLSEGWFELEGIAAEAPPLPPPMGLEGLVEGAPGAPPELGPRPFVAQPAPPAFTVRRVPAAGDARPVRPVPRAFLAGGAMRGAGFPAHGFRPIGPVTRGLQHGDGSGAR